MNLRHLFCVCLTTLIQVLGQPLVAEEEAIAYSGITESRLMFQDNCAVCHGENLEGAAQGPPLRGDLIYGASIEEIIASIGSGYPNAGMPAWRNVFSSVEIHGLAMYVLETRDNMDYVTSNYDAPLVVPTGVFETELHDFRLQTLVDDLGPLPFSLTPLPDGRLLVTEKTKGVRIIDANGEKSEIIEGTPTAYDDIYRNELRIDIERGTGWLFDIALHPNYAENGWIYLHHSHRCEDCNQLSREEGRPVSMNRLVRGRLNAEQRWVDQEVLWQAPFKDYFLEGDNGAGGRVAFDNHGHVFFSIGTKCSGSAASLQDLSKPCGKIHRINDDGSIPQDNPYAERDDVYRSIYSYGHRNPQGLEFDAVSGELWGSEHGPRGGDEINRLLPGENYGWPLYSLGLRYDGTRVDGKDLGISFKLSDIQQPVVDLTPSPAVSSFIISDSELFPNWRGDFLVGSLKARRLFRVDIENNRFITKETLFEGIGRVRDIEQGNNGEIYLLVEQGSGGKILKLIPVEAGSN
jgi:glucose/arabinose dehydrogenase